MTFLVLVAICLASLPQQQCQQSTAIAWVIAPEHPGSAEGCMRHGMLFAAESHLVEVGSYAKVFCRAGE